MSVRVRDDDKQEKLAIYDAMAWHGSECGAQVKSEAVNFIADPSVVCAVAVAVVATGMMLA